MKQKVVIIIPFWKRAKVSRLVSKQLDVFFAATKQKIDMVVVYIFSEEDPEISKQLITYKAAKHYKELLYCPNKYLGQKLNEGVKLAIRNGADYIMNFGSDDLIHPSIIDLYLPFMAKQTPLFGLNKLYFWESTGRCLHFSYYNNPHIVGAGRMIHIKTLKTVIKKFGALYDPKLQRCLDGNSATRMEHCGFKQLTIDPGQFPMVVDIKCDTNINSFDTIKQSSNRNGIKLMDGSIVESVFTDIIKLKKK